MDKTTLERKLRRPLTELNFSLRVTRFLARQHVDSMCRLVSLTEGDVLGRCFSETTLREIQEKLQEQGLSLGMTLKPTEDG